MSLGGAVAHSTAAPRISLIGQSPFSRNSKVPPDRAPVALAHFAESDLHKVPVLEKTIIYFSVSNLQDKLSLYMIKKKKFFCSKMHLLQHRFSTLYFELKKICDIQDY